MVIYKSIAIKLLKAFTMIFSLLILIHITISLILSNGLLYQDLIMVTLGILSITLIIFIIIFLRTTTKKTESYYSILLNECDPVKVLDLLESAYCDAVTKKTIVALNSIKFLALFRLANYDEAKKLLTEYKIESETNNPIRIILWKHNTVMVNIVSYDYEGLKIAKDEFLKLQTKYPTKLKTIQMYLDIQQKYSDLFEMQHEKLNKYYEEELKFTTYLSEIVSYNNNLAKIYYSQKEYSKCRECIKIVLENGNTMHAVQESKNLLERLGEL